MPGMRLRINRTAVLFLLLCLLGAPILAGAFGPKELDEATITQIHAEMKRGKLTAVELVQMYLDRIKAYDKQGPFVNSIVMINPNALETAAELDRKFKATGQFVGPLHGIPVIVKDNIDVAGLPTTNGTLALKDSVPPDDAFIIRKLREAGAIFIAKSNLAEFASSADFTVSSILPGYTRNPYDTLRTVGGSSGGTAAAIAANFATIGIGTDTGSSVRAPAAFDSLVGFRSTMGLISRDGIVPLNITRDISGPITRTVEDAVVMLDVVAGQDPADAATSASVGKIPKTYRESLVKDGLKGVRIGILRQLFKKDKTDPEILQLMERAIEDMRKAGAVIVDPVEIVDLDEITQSFKQISRLKYDFNGYLATLGPNAPMKSLEEILKSKKYHPFLTKTLEDAQKIEGKPEEHPDVQFNAGVEQRLRAAVLKTMGENSVDILAYPTANYPPRLIGDLNTPDGNNNRVLSPPTGFPAFSIPMGFTSSVLPAGIQFFGRPFTEPLLVKVSYAYEQATRHRRPPRSTPALKR
jgi:amidase